MGGSNTQNPGFQLAPSAGGAVYPQGLFPAAKPAATPADDLIKQATPMPHYQGKEFPAMQRIPAAQPSPTLYSTDGSIATLTPEQIALYNAEQRKVQQQHQQLEDSVNRASAQAQGQQNAAFEMHYAKQNSGFPLPKTNVNLSSPNPYGRDFSKTAEPEAPRD